MFSDFQNSFLNVLMFIPLGYLIPFCWPYFRKLHRTLILGFLTSLAIEVLQLFTFRASDINDLMTNTLGTLLGWLGMRLFSRYSFLKNNRLSISYLRISLGIALFVMIFFIRFFWAFFTELYKSGLLQNSLTQQSFSVYKYVSLTAGPNVLGVTMLSN